MNTQVTCDGTRKKHRHDFKRARTKDARERVIHIDDFLHAGARDNTCKKTEIMIMRNTEDFVKECI